MLRPGCRKPGSSHRQLRVNALEGRARLRASPCTTMQTYLSFGDAVTESLLRQQKEAIPTYIVLKEPCGKQHRFMGYRLDTLGKPDMETVRVHREISSDAGIFFIGSLGADKSLASVAFIGEFSNGVRKLDMVLLARDLRETHPNVIGFLGVSDRDARETTAIALVRHYKPFVNYRNSPEGTVYLFGNGTGHMMPMEMAERDLARRMEASRERF